MSCVLSWERLAGGNKKGAKYFLPLRRKLNVCVGLCPNPLHFLVLVQENEAKENQG